MLCINIGHTTTILHVEYNLTFGNLCAVKSFFVTCHIKMIRVVIERLSKHYQLSFHKHRFLRVINRLQPPALNNDINPGLLGSLWMSLLPEVYISIVPSGTVFHRIYCVSVYYLIKETSRFALSHYSVKTH